MATVLGLVPWIFAFVGYMGLVAETMYEIISLSDLENDYINPRELRQRINWIQVPQMAGHGIITASFLVFGRWIFLLLNLPLVAYNVRQYRRKLHLVDETEVFKEINFLQRQRIIKLVFYVVLVLLLMFRLILAAFE